MPPSHKIVLMQDFLDLCQSTFTEINGAIVLDNSEGRALAARDISSRIASTENEVNHQHFFYPIGETPWLRWQNNLALARALQECWTAKLRVQFPDDHFAFVIHNERSEGDWYGAPNLNIMPTLRMWTRRNDPADELWQGFCGDENRPDLIMLRVNYRPAFVPQEEVFTKQGTFRKSFIAQSADKCGRELTPK